MKAGGNQHREVWRLAGPIIVANLSIPLLGAVDTAVMGHLSEPYYLGAIAIGALIFSYLYWGFSFLRMGTTAFAAQASGAGDATEIAMALARAILSAAALGLAVVLIQAPIVSLALAFIDASAEVESHARSYYQIRIWGAPAALANFAILGWLFGIRRAGVALVMQIFMNGLNIVLDLWFVIGLGWGVEGVAAATVVSEYSACVLGFLLCKPRLRALRLTPRPLKFWIASVLESRAVARLFTVNRDIFVRTLCLVSAYAIFTARGARMGDVVLAANAVLLILQTFLSFGLDGFAQAAEAMVGGAKGARDRAALRVTVRVTTQWAAVTALVYALAYALLGEFLIALLTDMEEIKATARRYLPWLVASPLISVWCYQLDGIFIGATQSRDMRNAMILSFAVFVAAVALLQPQLGNHGLWLALMIFMVARAITLGVRYPRLERAVAERS